MNQLVRLFGDDIELRKEELALRKEELAVAHAALGRDVS